MFLMSEVPLQGERLKDVCPRPGGGCAARAADTRKYLNERWPCCSQEAYMGTSLTRKRTPLGTYRWLMPRVIGGVMGGGGVFSWARYHFALQITTRHRSLPMRFLSKNKPIVPGKNLEF